VSLRVFYLVIAVTLAVALGVLGLGIAADGGSLPAPGVIGLALMLVSLFVCDLGLWVFGGERR
jgi:hypothetical protein